VRVEGILDGLMYVGGPNHLLYLTQLEYKAIYRIPSSLGQVYSSSIAAEERGSIPYVDRLQNWDRIGQLYKWNQDIREVWVLDRDSCRF